MRARILRGIAALGLLCNCGPPPAQVAGTYTGGSSLVISGADSQTGSEFVTVTQSGGDISFSLGGCQLKASADGATSFNVAEVKCTKFIQTKTYLLNGNGKVTGNANAISVNLAGHAASAPNDFPYTWTFSGTKQ